MLRDLLKNPAATEGEVENEPQPAGFTIWVLSAILYGLT